jgi:hypothetical protein
LACRAPQRQANVSLYIREPTASPGMCRHDLW